MLSLACLSKLIKLPSIFGRRMKKTTNILSLCLILPNTVSPLSAWCGQSSVLISVVLPSQNGIHCSQGLWTITLPKTSIPGIVGGRAALHSYLF